MFLTLFLTLGFTAEVAPAKIETPSIEKQIDSLRYNNKVLLRYIHFKTKFGNYEQYYKQADSVLPEQ